MAKSGKPAPRPQAQAAKTPASSKTSLPAKDWLDRPPADQADVSLRRIFYGLAGFVLLVMLWLALGSGVNADDKYQVDYSNKLVNYYGTFGKDTAALHIPDGNMHLYGGFFEIVTGLPIKPWVSRTTSLPSMMCDTSGAHFSAGSPCSAPHFLRNA